MAKDLYPHLVVRVDTEPFYADLVSKYNQVNQGDYHTKKEVYKEIQQRVKDISMWLVKHGYQCGRDYQETHSGYRFASEPLALMFTLVWSR